MGRDNHASRVARHLIAGMLVVAVFGELPAMTGCAFVRGKYGDQFDAADIESIKKGVSTRTEVATLLGAPDRIIEVNEHEIFQYYNYDVKSGTLLFLSRTNIKGQDLYIFFKNGVVDDVVFGKPKSAQKFQFWPFGD
jgi:outer membrane protein assembly factor BamE (lipoprotein component of BamABCDE complex)